MQESSEQSRQAPRQEEADVWQVFQSKFEHLTNEEKQLIRARKLYKDSYLDAHCVYREHTEIFREKRKPGEGRFCLLKAPETGQWKLSSSVSENFREKFCALAARAAKTLGCLKGTEPVDFWLDRLYRYLLNNRSDQVLAVLDDENLEGDVTHRGVIHRGESGVIPRVCEASATFCSWLERQAFDQSERSGARRVQKSGERKNKSRGERQTVAPKPALVVKTIAKLQKELEILRPQMNNESSYTKLQRKYPKYLVFKIANRHENVSSWLERMQERRLRGLAQEIAAIYHNVQKTTARKYWSHRRKRS
jgi:hypothetical protein